MQKKLIAMAVAGLVSGAAFAQSNVTIYGVMDTTWESIKVSSANSDADNVKSRTRLASNSSYIGFKGAESLGNGLTAVFQIESSIASDNSKSGVWNDRDTMVALAGGFGTIAAGNLTGPVRAIGAAVDFNPGASSSGFTGSMYGELAGIKTGTDERSRNAVAYISPTFGGLYGVIAYQNGTPTNDNPAVDKKSKAWTAGLVYANGPLFVGFGYIDAKEPALLGDDRLKDYRLAAKYSFSTGTTVSGLYDRQKYTVGSDDTKRTAYMLGINQNFGASNVWFQYARAKDLKGDLLATTDTGAKQFTLGYSYAMSKRTMLHAFYSSISNDDGAAYDFYVNGVGKSAHGVTGLDTIGAGGKGRVYAVGMRHTF